MTQKERLSKLIDDYYTSDLWTVDKHLSLEQHLLSNGVIVPPCKVGDTVWFHICSEKGCFSTAKGEVTAIVKREVEDFLEICSYNIIICRSFDEVFLTSEAAEKALKEREAKCK